MGIPAASAYPQYSGNVIAPIFRIQLLDRWYCSTVYSDISSTEYTGDLAKGGDQIIFVREPKVAVHKYNKIDQIQDDTIDCVPVTMTLGQAYQFSIKMSRIDEEQIQNFDAWKAGFLKSAVL